MRTLLGAFVGLAAGYTLARALEARASGVPVGRALAQWDTPIARLREDLAGRAVEVRKLDPDAPLAPSWYGEEGA